MSIGKADVRENIKKLSSAGQKSAAEEVSVIEKAKEILSSGVKVFLQVDKSANDADAMKREQVSKLLRDLAQENHVYALSQIASEAQAGGPFDKVIGMIESPCSFFSH